MPDTYKDTSNLKPFLASAILQALRQTFPASWKANTPYTIGGQVTSFNKVYAATKTGNSGSVPPSHSSGTALDGNTEWLFISQAQNSGDIFSNLYAVIGSPGDWQEGDTPPVPTTGSNQERDTMENAITLLRLTSVNARLGIKNIEWVTGTLYDQYTDDKDATEYVNPFYVIVDSDNIYVCIDNNNGAVSTEKPTGKSLSLVRLADNYIWKYVGSVSTTDIGAFGTSTSVPIAQKLFNDSSEQWAIQQSAKPGEISTFKEIQTNGQPFIDAVVSVMGSGTGASAAIELNASQFLQDIYVTTPGQDYNSESVVIVQESDAVGTGGVVALTVNPDGTVAIDSVVSPGQDYTTVSLFIVGDGTGAEATVTLSGGQVVSATMVNGGTGYSWASAYLIPGDAVAIAQVVLGPAAGHGKNILTELCANRILFSFQISSTDSPYVVPSDIRQIALMSGVQGMTGSQTNASLYMGPKHPYYGSVGSFNKYKKYSGYLLYVENIEVIQHKNTLQETIKISFII